VLPAILVIGVSFAATQFLWANRVDSNLVDIAAAAVSLVVTLLFLRVWQPKRIWRFEDERAPAAVGNSATKLTEVADTLGDEWKIQQLQRA
jgi:L-lactate permease